MNFLLITQTFISLFQTLAGLMPQGTTQDKFEATIVGVQGVFGDVTSILPALSGLATSVDTAISAAGSGGTIDFKLLVGTAMNLIKNVEELMPNSAGDDKFNVVVSGLNTLVGDVTAFIPQLKAFATSAVNALRAADVFKAPIAAPAAEVAAMVAVPTLSSVGSPVGMVLGGVLNTTVIVPAVQTSA